MASDLHVKSLGHRDRLLFNSILKNEQHVAKILNLLIQKISQIKRVGVTPISLIRSYGTDRIILNDNLLMKERRLTAPHVAIEFLTLLLYIWDVRGSNIWWLSSVYTGKFESFTKTRSTPLLFKFFIFHYHYSYYHVTLHKLS
jgi:hypothetical protein